MNLGILLMGNAGSIDIDINELDSDSDSDVKSEPESKKYQCKRQLDVSYGHLYYDRDDYAKKRNDALEQLCALLVGPDLQVKTMSVISPLQWI